MHTTCSLLAIGLVCALAAAFNAVLTRVPTVNLMPASMICCQVAAAAVSHAGCRCCHEEGPRLLLLWTGVDDSGNLAD